jgi:hypothetical protein
MPHVLSVTTLLEPERLPDPSPHVAVIVQMRPFLFPDRSERSST